MAATLVAAAAGSSLSAQVVTLRVPGRSSEHASIAAQGSFVAVAWAGATSSAMDIYAATSRDGGSTFSAPVRVNAVPGDARVGGEQPPRVVLVPRHGADPGMVVVWTSKGSAGTRLLTAWSSDGGHSFGPNDVVPGGEGPGNRGWESAAVDGTGRVHVLWLDHRETVMPAAMHHQGGSPPAPEAKPDPVEKAGKSQLFVAALDGTGARSLARGVCYCCKTTVAASGSAVVAVWRHVFPGNQRDIAFTISRDGGKTFAAPVRVSEDHWAFDGCPENGPAVAVDPQQRAHVVWPTPADGKDGAPLALYHAMSRDGSRFTSRDAIPTAGPAGHVQAAIGATGDLLVAWDEQVPTGKRVAVARGTTDADGRTRYRAIPLPAGAEGARPVLAGSLVAWVKPSPEGNVIAVARIR